MSYIYLSLADASMLSINRSYWSDRIQSQGDELARFIEKPLVFEEQPDE